MPILEHQYHPVDYRNVCDLRKVSYAARALYLELFCAAGKTTHGVVDVRLALLEEESGIPGTQIPALLVELVTAGLIAYDAKNRIAYHVGSALRHCDNKNNRAGWVKVAAGLPAGPVKMAFESELAGVAWQSDTPCIPYRDRIETVSEPLSYGIDNSNSNSNDNKNSNKEPSVAKATDTSPFGNEASGPFPEVEQQEPQGLPDPWAKLAEQYADPMAAERYLPKGPSLTPTAALRLAQADARKAGILLPEPEPQQLAMDLPAAKPAKKPMTDAQLDAIFAQKQLAIAVDIWNEELGSKTCGPCSLKDVRKMATQLMGNLAKYTNSGGESPAKLMGWAAVRSDFHSGKALGTRTWTFQKWMTAEHLASVYADYRKDRGDSRPIMYQHERTLRDWRLETEAAELRKKIEAVNEAA